MTVNYRCPVRFPDPLLVRTQCARIGRTSFVLEAAIWSSEAQQVCAEGSFVIVLLDYGAGNRPVAVPEPVRAAMRALDPALVESASGSAARDSDMGAEYDGARRVSQPGEVARGARVKRSAGKAKVE